MNLLVAAAMVWWLDVYVEERQLTPDWEARVAEVLRQIRPHNPLLFDFMLKRHLRWQGKALPKSVFETRAFFQA